MNQHNIKKNEATVRNPINTLKQSRVEVTL